MAKRKNLPSIKDHDPLVPIDVTNLGNENDCFGQAYDLTTKECKLCGDSELCALKMSQNLNITRKQLNEKNHFKDLDILEDIPAIKKYMIFDRNGKLIEGNMFTDEAQTKLKRCSVSAKVLKSVDFYGKRY